MQIQRIEFPLGSENLREEMYIRNRCGRYRVLNQEVLTMGHPSGVLFNTYFNAVSIEKWLKYTRLDNLRFEFSGKGEYAARVWQEYVAADGNFCRNSVAEICISSGEKETYEIPIPLKACQKGILYIELETLGTGGCEFAEGRFLTETSVKQEISLALDICTYKREEYLYHNLEIIERELWNNPRSVLFHNIHIMVVDNGRTIPQTAAREWLSIYPNKNAGGAAGFARGMLEASHKEAFTHVLLMDDDIEINPSALERTYVLLNLLKEEYKEAMIGGAMLRRDYSFVQQESGGSYRQGRIRSLHTGVDLRKAESVILNEKEEDTDYNAWWYCCIPMSLIKKKGLPLPLFIHDDDVEYGLRCGTEIILMNGICVWHEAFEHKRPSANEYYDVRNTLIVNALHNQDYQVVQAIKMVYRRMLTNLFRYRYRDIRLNERALLDFLRGPAWLMEQDAEKLHQELAAAGYRYQESYDQPKEKREHYNVEDILSGRCSSNQIEKRKLLSLNGWLLPTEKNGRAVPIMAGESPHRYYRKEDVWIYDPDTELGFYVKKEPKQLFSLLWIMIRSYFRLKRNYKRVQAEYRQYAAGMCSCQFWNKYLNLEGEKNENKL